MRTVSLWLLAAALMGVGCTGANDIKRGPCDELLACAAIAAPDKLNEHLGNYGENGSCWKSLDRSLCEKSCTSLITQLAAAKPGITECAGTSSVVADGGMGQDASTMTDAGTDMSGPPPCGPATCSGCCSAGVCKPGGASDSCGQGGAACSICGTSQICSAARSCGVDPNEMITLVVANASISSRTPAGIPWDAPFGDPDPYVVVNAKSTGLESDTLSPSWGTIMSFTRKDLMVDGVTVSMYDKDVSSDDLIAGPRTLRVTETDLIAGKIDWYSWESVRYITFMVRK